MVVKSWGNNEMLADLAEKQRNGEIVEGVIRSIRTMNMPQEVDGKVKSVEQETLIVALPGGVTGYCPASEYREHAYRSLNQFITHEDSFVITKLDLDNQVAILSEKKAAEQLRDVFWTQIELLKAEGKLDDEIFTGTVTGYNQESGIIYARISGQDTYMFRNEWSWRERDVVDAQQGEKIKVKVLRFDKEQKLVRVSRKQSTPDPFLFVEKLQVGQMIAGRVVDVHPIHGLFVEVENGVVLKASKVRALEEPDVGEFVTCRVQRIDVANRRGRLVIINYPRGKRKKIDLGSFLFE